MTLRLRAATIEDAVDIARIYNAGIAERIATFERRTANGGGDRGVAAGSIRALLDGTGRARWAVVGWAGASEYRARECDAGIADFSVYVESSARGRGVGRAAMVALVDSCETRGFWKLVSPVFPDNEASLRLLRSIGFREVGLYRRHAPARRCLAGRRHRGAPHGAARVP
ncbi:MAG TPA: GNAT family N-acetyltransferase [Candidatus Limnocylindria bacterium]|nr:GNAT family N-acetyltransferase [Candidatus Limnocylindria bacterium]